MENEEKWELAIIQYFQVFSWVKVATTLNIKKKTIYAWLSNPKFKQMISFEHKKIIKELTDKLRNNTEIVNIELLKLIKQNSDLKIKLEAIKEFNRKFEKVDELMLVEDSIQLAKDSQIQTSNEDANI